MLDRLSDDSPWLKSMKHMITFNFSSNEYRKLIIALEDKAGGAEKILRFMLRQLYNENEFNHEDIDSIRELLIKMKVVRDYAITNDMTHYFETPMLLDDLYRTIFRREQLRAFKTCSTLLGWNESFISVIKWLEHLIDNMRME